MQIGNKDATVSFGTSARVKVDQEKGIAEFTQCDTVSKDYVEIYLVKVLPPLADGLTLG